MPIGWQRNHRKSIISNFSDALALAANEDAVHPMCCLASVNQRCVGSMPARVVGIVSRGTAFALGALTARTAMQHDLMRAGYPVFINIEFRCFRSRPRRLGYESHFRYNSL